MDGFLRVARSGDLELGSELSLRVMGRRILLRRRADGALQALELACRHQNADLTTATRAGTVLTCSRHGWQYDLTTGACLNEPWAALRRFAVQEDATGHVWVSIAPQADS